MGKVRGAIDGGDDSGRWHLFPSLIGWHHGPLGRRAGRRRRRRRHRQEGRLVRGTQRVVQETPWRLPARRHPRGLDLGKHGSTQQSFHHFWSKRSFFRCRRTRTSWPAERRRGRRNGRRRPAPRRCRPATMTWTASSPSPPARQVTNAGRRYRTALDP